MMVDFNINNNLISSLSIKERLDVFKINNHFIKDEKNNIEQWKKGKSLINNNSFLTMLKNQNISESEFNYSIKNLDDRDKEELFNELKKKDWYNTFLDIIKSIEKEDIEFSKNTIDLSYAFKPFLIYFYRDINEYIKKLNTIKISNEAANELINSLANILIKCSQKTLVIELHEFKKNDILVGDTPKDRLDYFLKANFSDLDQILKFYNKYPTLSRLLVIKTMNFIINIKEALKRLDTDFDEIEKELEFHTDSKVIKKLNCGQGDSHQKGRSVLQIIFENDKSLIYKPKNLNIAKKYYEFLEWFNKNSNLLDLPINKGFYKDKYTFEKFIEYKGCTDERQIENYYKRFGEIISIAYFLCGNDFHFENIIAHGEYPYL